jgi:pSer/pThr/pTyr-binding forkhead associated (FHA) protein
MRLELEIVSGPLTGKTIVATSNQLVRIGRTNKADFATEDSFMSGEHFAVEKDEVGWKIRDLKSRNGTKLNGQQITATELHEGDKIHAGSTNFIVHLKPEATNDSKRASNLLTTLPPAIPIIEPTNSFTREMFDPRRKTNKIVPQPQEAKPTRAKRTKKSAGSAPAVTPEPASPVPPHVQQKKPEEVSALRSYEAATPAGRLMQFFYQQSQPLFGLLDATHEPRLPNLLLEAGEEFRSLYQNPENEALAPYLVQLPANSNLLQRMIEEGWGKAWGVYLTTSVSLEQLRDYFRRELMVRLPDGVELFSRFYDPRFFRAFLDSCTRTEAEKFFGPISSYLMEDERPEIVLKYELGSEGVQKQGHLLSETILQ